MLEQDDGKTYLTVDETCKTLSISRQTLDTYVKRGLLTRHKRTFGLGRRRVYYDRAEVEKLLRIE